jgi:butyryl-CoA dehydrogenase
MIHEGTHGIQALDLLGRKVVMDGGAGLDVVREAIDATIARAAPVDALAEHAQALRRAADDVAAATRAAWSTGVPAEALANATPYLQAFGHLVLAWIWLDVATCAAAAAPSDAQRGRLAACRYFFRYELPRSAPGSASSRRATTPAARCRRNRFERLDAAPRHADLGADLRRPVRRRHGRRARALGRVVRLELHRRRHVAVAAGCVLVWLRSRMPEP